MRHQRDRRDSRDEEGVAGGHLVSPRLVDRRRGRRGDRGRQAASHHRGCCCRDGCGKHGYWRRGVEEIDEIDEIEVDTSASSPAAAGPAPSVPNVPIAATKAIQPPKTIGEIPDINRRVSDMKTQGRETLDALHKLILSGKSSAGTDEGKKETLATLKEAIKAHAGFPEADDILKDRLESAICSMSNDALANVVSLLGITVPTERSDRTLALKDFILHPVDPSWGSSRGQRIFTTYKCGKLVEKYTEMRMAAKPAAPATPASDRGQGQQRGPSEFQQVDLIIDEFLEKSDDLRKGKPFDVFGHLARMYARALVLEALAPTGRFRPDVERTAYEFAMSAMFNEPPGWLDETVRQLAALKESLQRITDEQEQKRLAAAEAASARLVRLHNQTEAFVEGRESGLRASQKKKSAVRETLRNTIPLRAAKLLKGFIGRLRGLDKPLVPPSQKDFPEVRALSKLTTFQRNCIEQPIPIHGNREEPRVETGTPPAVHSQPLSAYEIVLEALSKTQTDDRVMNYFEVHQALPPQAPAGGYPAGGYRGDDGPRARAVAVLRQIQLDCRTRASAALSANAADKKKAVKQLLGIRMDRISRIAYYPQSKFGEKLAVAFSTADLMRTPYVTSLLGHGYGKKGNRAKATDPRHVAFNQQLQAVEAAGKAFKDAFPNKGKQLVDLRKGWAEKVRTNLEIRDDDGDDVARAAAVDDHVREVYSSVVGKSSPPPSSATRIIKEIEGKGGNTPFWVLVRISLSVCVSLARSARPRVPVVGLGFSSSRTSHLICLAVRLGVASQGHGHGRRTGPGTVVDE